MSNKVLFNGREEISLSDAMARVAALPAASHIYVRPDGVARAITAAEYEEMTESGNRFPGEFHSIARAIELQEDMEEAFEPLTSDNLFFRVSDKDRAMRIAMERGL